MAKPVTQTSPRYYDRPEILAQLKVCKNTLGSMISRGVFPAPVEVTDSNRSLRWLVSEVDEYHAKCLRRRDLKRSSSGADALLGTVDGCAQRGGLT